MIERRPLRQSTDSRRQNATHVPIKPPSSILQSTPLPIPEVNAHPLSPRAIRALQQSHGNQVTLRLIGRLSATKAGSGSPVQRYLMTSNQFIHGVGFSPHGDVKLFAAVGPTVKKQSTHYKAVLDGLDRYHRAIETLSVSKMNSDQVLIEYLDDIVRSCKNYSSREEKPDSKMRSWLDLLINDATLEKRAINRIARSAAVPPTDQKWQDALGGFGELGGLVVPGDAQIEPMANPGVEAAFNKSTTIFSDLALKTPVGTVAKGDLCVRHTTSKRKVIYVETYTMDKATGKEEPKFGAKGYVGAKFVDKSVYTHTIMGSDAPIFMHPPSIEDINQQAIGDCYLLAALGSIVKADPAAIYNLIRDNRDGTVTVRLFDIVANPPRPKYLQIEKSVVSHRRHSAGPLWVPMLEKAYAALGINYDRGPHQGSSSYVQLGEGGKSSIAFMVLTGTPGATEGTLGAEGSAIIGSIKPWSRGEVFKHKAGKLDEMISYTLFNKDPTLTGKWIAFLSQAGVIEELETATRIEQFEPILTKYRLDDDVKTPLMAELRLVFPGKRGTGTYTPQLIAIYKEISSALKNHKYVAIGSKQRVAKREEGKGISAGESKAKGLAGSHAYSVLAVHKDPITGRRWLRVRNPWGDEGAATVASTMRTPERRQARSARQQVRKPSSTSNSLT